MSQVLPREASRPSDYSQQIYESLPDNAKQYYVERSEKHVEDLCYKLSFGEKLCRGLNLARIYPLFSLRYLNANEFCGAVVSGEHRLYNGPGFQWVVGINDHMYEPVVIGNDINFGPIKIIYVRPGNLKFARFRDSGRPMLLGPGMHYFNDLNLEIGGEISMNFNGDNQTIRCDDSGAFQFVFVRNGSEAIIISRSGELNTLGPGLHFIQAPDALKTFVSVQLEHFRFGSFETNQYFLTADNIELRINATIFFRISDVRTMFSTRIKDPDDLRDTLHSQAMATLLTIIRSECFHNIGQRGQSKSMDRDLREGFSFGDTDENAIPTAEATALGPAPSAPKSDDVLQTLNMGFQNIIHDAEPQFRRMMQSNFSSSGIEVQSLRIEQIEFADHTMQRQVRRSSFNREVLTPPRSLSLR